MGTVQAGVSKGVTADRTRGQGAAAVRQTQQSGEEARAKNKCSGSEERREKHAGRQQEGDRLAEARRCFVPVTPSCSGKSLTSA